MFIKLNLAILVLLGVFNLNRIEAGCPVTDNPSQMFQCLTINPQAFIDLISKGDYKSFCHMANGYMTCMTTYLRDCLGGKAATGILEELQDLNLKCCISGRNQECVVKNPALLQKCFALDNIVTLADGREKLIGQVNIGDKLKAIDSNGQSVDSEVVSILHKDSNSSTLFQTFHDSNGNSVSMTSQHLIFEIGHGKYIKAAKIQVGDKLRVFSTEKQGFDEFLVSKISFDVKQGFIAPLTNHGTLMVNGVDASCYAEINNHHLADLFMYPVKMWHQLSKTFAFANSKFSQDEVNPSLYSNILYKFASNFMSSYFY